jgi:hypothetical protein
LCAEAAVPGARICSPWLAAEAPPPVGRGRLRPMFGQPQLSVIPQWGDVMRVELQTTGHRRFFAQPEAPIAIDVCRLSERERAAFRQLVSEARFFELPAQLPSPLGADDRTCQITINDMGRQHTVTVSAAFPGPALRRLIDLLRTLTAD